MSKVSAKGDAAIDKAKQRTAQKKMVKVYYRTEHGKLKWRMEENV